ncbi:MAG: response regulator [Bacteroidetes bacterium]|nr:response regulator [Bacteroidota bacterium]MBS1684926.1 response regulator [Bacteroidota bacterium]
MPTRPLRILLVDDDPEDATLFSIALQSVDSTAAFTHAPNGEAALSLLFATQEIPDFIFLDINMPGMNGKECLHEIKKLPLLSQVPVVMHSTSNHYQDIEDTRALGAACYMVKPMMYTDLEDMIRFILCEQHPAGVYMHEAVEVF